jgi:serine/threonine protein kinase
MSEPRATPISAPATDLELELQHRLDALIRGERSEDEFMDEISALLHGAPHSTWNTVALIHQRYRQEELSADAFRSIVSRIVGRELDTTRYSTSVGPKIPLTEQPSVPIDDRDPTTAIEIGRVLRDRYVIDKGLGSGATGTVFRARDRCRCDLPEPEQYVAIKISHEKIDDRAERLAHLRSEFCRTQMLSHRNIVRMYELDRDGDLDFFTMELLEGEPLSSVLERLHSQPMSRPYAWAIIRQMGSALAHAHARDVIHADLRPQNIMITDSGEVRMLGFGNSSTAAEQAPELGLRRKNGVSAAPIYACCELLEGRSADPRDDIYALACMSYELLEGTHPFQNRPSTVARDLAIVPTRLPGLTRQQWKTLAMGLSFHRAGRSIPVREWLSKLDADRVAARQLPCARELRPAPAKARPMPPLRAAVLFAVFLMTATVWIPLIHLAPAGRVRGDEVAPALAANQQLDSGAVSSTNGARPDRKGPVDPGPSEARPPSAAADGRSQVANNATRDANRSKPTGAVLSPIVISYPGEDFAEIRVHRSSLSRGNAAFVWWTEGASAKPGIDYVYQGKVTQSFPKGKSSTSFFIKLIPNSSRTQPEVFYVAIADADRGASSGQIARAAIWLPTSRGHS